MARDRTGEEIQMVEWRDGSINSLIMVFNSCLTVLIYFFFAFLFGSTESCMITTCFLEMCLW